MAFTSLIHKRAIPVLHALLDYATPTKAMIRQLSVPLVVVVSDFAFEQLEFGAFAFSPHFAALEFIGFALRVRVGPCIEELARIASLRLALVRAVAHRFALRRTLLVAV